MVASIIEYYFSIVEIYFFLIIFFPHSGVYFWASTLNALNPLKPKPWQIGASIMESYAFDYLDAPMERVAGADVMPKP